MFSAAPKAGDATSSKVLKERGIEREVSFDVFDPRFEFVETRSYGRHLVHFWRIWIEANSKW